MMRKALTPILVLMATSLVACEPPPADDTDASNAAPATEMAPAADADAVAAEVSSIRDAWVRAAEANDAETVSSLYAEDARMIGPDGAVSDGRDAIRESLAPGFGMLENLEVTSTELLVGTDMASDMGRFEQTVRTAEGEEQTLSGPYLVVLQRQADGAWRIVQHLAAPEPMESPTM